MPKFNSAYSFPVCLNSNLIPQKYNMGEEAIHGHSHLLEQRYE